MQLTWSTALCIRTWRINFFPSSPFILLSFFWLKVYAVFEKEIFGLFSDDGLSESSFLNLIQPCNPSDRQAWEKKHRGLFSKTRTHKQSCFRRVGAKKNLPRQRAWNIFCLALDGIAWKVKLLSTAFTWIQTFFSLLSSDDRSSPSAFYNMFEN